MARPRSSRQNPAVVTPGRRRGQAQAIETIDRLETITIRRLVILRIQLESGEVPHVATLRRQLEASFIKRLSVLRELRDSIIIQARRESEHMTGIPSELRVRINPLSPSADLEGDEMETFESLRVMLGAGQADAAAG
jgi:hypothetical protein